MLITIRLLSIFGHLQVQGFLTAQPRAVVHRNQSTMLGVRRRIQQSADFSPAPDRRQLAAHLGLDDLLIEPDLLQRARVQELQRRPGALEGSPGQLPLVEQIQQPGTDMFRAELIG
jgi:hypothetical protein